MKGLKETVERMEGQIPKPKPKKPKADGEVKPKVKKDDQEDDGFKKPKVVLPNLYLDGGLIVLPGGMHNEDPKAFKDVSLMTTMFVSGTVKGDPPHISNTLHSIFGGDLVVSGGLRVGEGRGHHGNNTWYGGTISGSIHRRFRS